MLQKPVGCCKLSLWLCLLTIVRPVTELHTLAAAGTISLFSFLSDPLPCMFQRSDAPPLSWLLLQRPGRTVSLPDKSTAAGSNAA